jgi:hypothetical protein
MIQVSENEWVCHLILKNQNDCIRPENNAILKTMSAIFTLFAPNRTIIIIIILKKVLSVAKVSSHRINALTILFKYIKHIIAICSSI